MIEYSALEQDFQKLGPEEYDEFREWFRTYDAERWNRQIEEDTRCGRPVRLAEEAETALKAGSTKPS